MTVDLLQSRANQWGVILARTEETPGSVLGYGLRGVKPVVIKLIKNAGDEWHSGEIVRSFNGAGMVQAYESEAGAMLLERLEPGTELVELVRKGDDESATDTLAQVMQQLSHHSALIDCPAVSDWGRGFERYLATGDTRIPASTVAEAHQLFRKLADSQRSQMLLHGDLHHYNVLFDSTRGWVAIDPKGVIGELEYEVGAILRNPIEKPDLITSPAVIERRLARLVQLLGIDYQRTVAWSYAQAVLSAIWEIEDTASLSPRNPSLQLARVLKPMVT